MKIAAFIPARKNSKRILNKNRLKLGKNYCLQMVINNLQRAGIIDDIFISTDDTYLKDKISGAIFLDRNNMFVDDNSTVIELLNYHQNKELLDYDLIILCYIHSICIDGATYKKAISNFKGSDKNRLMSVSNIATPLEWLLKEEGARIIPTHPGAEIIRSQDLTKAFYNTGQFYMYKSAWYDKKCLEDTDYYHLKRYQGVDLDEPEDLELLESFYRFNKSINKNLY
jgi:CMP-N-acetylneuraminic acid synthetase